MRFFFIITILFFVSCKNESTKTESASTEKMYFNLTKIVQADIDSNSKNYCGEEKTITVNNQMEKQTLARIDWKKEMQLLLDCDINKPSWKGKFDADTIWKEDTTLVSISYRALTDKIQVRRMYVQYNNDNQIANITINKKIKSFLFSNEQQIVYQPAKSFKINSQQKAFYMNDFISEVEVKFLCKN